jgi:hypothetical protein
MSELVKVILYFLAGCGCCSLWLLGCFLVWAFIYGATRNNPDHDLP